MQTQRSVFIFTRIPKTRVFIVEGNPQLIILWELRSVLFLLERYESMTKLYYREATAAIICYDLNDFSTFEKAKFWAEEIQEHREDAVIYLVGTKGRCRLRSFPVPCKVLGKYRRMSQARMQSIVPLPI